MARYDRFVDWYVEFRPSLPETERDALARLLGEGTGECLDLGCGTGVAIPVLRDLGWRVTGVDVAKSMLELADPSAAEILEAPADALPFADGAFDAAVSLWTHTDVDDFPGALAEVARVLRPGAPFAYIGSHPCFNGPHSRFIEAQGVPELHSGYLREGRYGIEAPGVGPDGLRAKVGGVHFPLGRFLQTFLDIGFALERFEELENRPYPYSIAMRWRR